MTGEITSTSRAQLTPHLFQILRDMDASAVTRYASGLYTGLSGYGYHARPDLSRPQTEVEWSREIGRRLNQLGFDTRTEVRYPVAGPAGGRASRCDLVIRDTAGHRLWVEVKGAWRNYWGGRSAIYRAYLLYPLIESTSPKSHTVPNDLAKLARLDTTSTDEVAQLLIGFESPDDPMDGDVRELENLAGLGTWQVATDRWDSPTVEGERARCWMWSRPVG